LQKIYGSKATFPIKYDRSNWLTDPHFLGSYSYFGVGCKKGDFDELAKPVENSNLFIAGEATYGQFPGTVEGAVVSGKRAALAILDRLDNASFDAKMTTDRTPSHSL